MTQVWWWAEPAAGTEDETEVADVVPLDGVRDADCEEGGVPDARAACCEEDEAVIVCRTGCAAGAEMEGMLVPCTADWEADVDDTPLFEV